MRQSIRYWLALMIGRYAEVMRFHATGGAPQIPSQIEAEKWDKENTKLYNITPLSTFLFLLYITQLARSFVSVLSKVLSLLGCVSRDVYTGIGAFFSFRVRERIYYHYYYHYRIVLLWHQTAHTNRSEKDVDPIYRPITVQSFSHV